MLRSSCIIINLAACCNEAFKIATNSSGCLNNYMQYTGNTGVYTYTFEYAQNEGCAVCGSSVIPMELNPDDKLQSLIDHLLETPKFQLKKPSLRCNGRNLCILAIMKGPLQSF